MKRFFKRLCFFMSIVVAALGFSPSFGLANTGQTTAKYDGFKTLSGKDIAPLQLDKAVQNSKASSFMQLAGHYSHSSHASHSSHSSHRSGY